MSLKEREGREQQNKDTRSMRSKAKGWRRRVNPVWSWLLLWLSLELCLFSPCYLSPPPHLVPTPTSPYQRPQEPSLDTGPEPASGLEASLSFPEASEGDGDGAGPKTEGEEGKNVNEKPCKVFKEEGQSDAEEDFGMRYEAFGDKNECDGSSLQDEEDSTREGSNLLGEEEEEGGTASLQRTQEQLEIQRRKLVEAKVEEIQRKKLEWSTICRPQALHSFLFFGRLRDNVITPVSGWLDSWLGKLW